MRSLISPFIKSYIKDNGFKQKAVAERLGYDPKVFSNMLNGRKAVTDRDILQIAKALSVTPNDLFAQSIPYENDHLCQ